MIILAIIAVLVLGGGASVVAESAVPGDLLYAVKTSVNEEVLGAIAVGVEADAKWETKLAERRLDEAVKLEERGGLTVETEADLSAEFTSHAEAVLKAVSAMQAEGRGEAAVGLTTALEAVTSAHAELFTAREHGSGMATGRRAFVLPHVLEAAGDILAPRDSATGQASGRVQAADVNGDGTADVAFDGAAKDAAKVNKVDSFTIKQKTAVDGSSKDSGSDADASAGASIQIKAGYDLGTQKKI